MLIPSLGLIGLWLQMPECKQSQIWHFFFFPPLIQGQLTLTVLVRLHPQSNSFDVMVTYILTKFGAEWLLFTDARV